MHEIDNLSFSKRILRSSYITKFIITFLAVAVAFSLLLIAIFYILLLRLGGLNHDVIQGILIGFSVIIIIYVLFLLLVITGIVYKIFLPLKELIPIIKENFEQKRLEKIEVPETSKDISFLYEFFNQSVEELRIAQEKVIEAEKWKAYSKIATQVAHDIRSPLTALNSLLEEANELPEKQRLMMRNAAQRINDIANNLLAEYKQPEGQQTQGESQGEIEPCLIYPIIDQVVSEKRQVLDNNQSLEFEVADRQTMMSYAKVNRAELARVISNLVNNALEATDSTEGLIQITLAVNNDQLIISITDNGPGMSEEQLRNILNPEQKTQSTKAQGHGIGITHAQETLKRFRAEFDMRSTPGEGTTAELTLKAVKPPLWIARELTVHPQDTIIILDDDPSMHDAWERFLANYRDQLSAVDIQHFTDTQACIEAIRQLNRPYQTLLLADYELMKQTMNGLDVVQATQLPRSVLVTSHYNNPDIIKRAILLGTYILPKELSASVQLAVQEAPLEPPQVGPADLVLLEDDRGFAASIRFLYKKKGRGSRLTIYHTPYELFYYLPCYSQDTPICLDYQFECPVTGLDIAQSLYQAGYTQLYLATGFHMNPDDMPEYIQLIQDKMDITYL